MFEMATGRRPVPSGSPLDLLVAAIRVLPRADALEPRVPTALADIIAKGLAVDAAARELEPLKDFAIDAGGDLYLGGLNREHAPWSVGIRHPRLDRELIDSLRVSDTAVCTSGDYERPGSGAEHHILDPRSGTSPVGVASVTVVAPNALLADALATAAFVLGPVQGLALLERHGVEGLIVTSALECLETPALPR